MLDHRDEEFMNCKADVKFHSTKQILQSDALSVTCHQSSHLLGSSQLSSNKPKLMLEGTKISNTFAQLFLVLEQLLKPHKCRSDEQEDVSFLSIMLKSVTNIKCLSIDGHLLSLIGLCTTSLQDPKMGCYIESNLSQSTQSGDDDSIMSAPK